MKNKNRERMNQILGPEGEPLTIADLPPATCTRWIARRKSIIVIAVNNGLLSVGDACSRYGLSVPEFVGWQSSYAAHGLPGLKATGPFVGHSIPPSRPY
jgi:hypothetical protein